MEEKRVFIMTKYEYNFLLTILNEYRHQLIKEGKSTDFVNEVLMNLINTPVQKKTLFSREKVGYER